ncbi:efflux RND transporter periplasmic adaptor subunit [Chitinophaga pendula]|uniref:efflux RND transporter periplasmic adaptor subunit n=1 Tax=Chitinophaga TaxID=79328 RepID=UPI000BAFD504|nr:MULTISPECIES: HlyD family efflux transporter periplasmic adaptor subunit [Chitinophaga]ASZ11916.1 efflux transporter periplasmic adaptor subunit [Chitinophaga sp. MD30]UCJ05056.1 efflux RND transporter periplasmic adaptor subunit [Chitinophaga pendula]
MDTLIEPAVRLQKKRKLIRLAVMVVMVLVAIILLLRFFLSPSVHRGDIRVAVVETGNIENTLPAGGEVLPEFEEVITSPINAAVQQVLLDAGSTVSSGQSILTLDKRMAEAEYAKQRIQLESKQAAIKKLKVALDKSFYDIQSSNQVKQLRISSLETEVDNAQHLFKAGGGTRADIEKAELELQVARLEKQQLENEIKSKQQSMQIEMREAELAAAVQENDLQELGRKLKLASIAASRAGVVTWANRNIGANVREGDALVRIADLRSFKVQGTIADQYLGQLRNGMSAIIRVSETMTIRGTVVNIQPAIQNGIVTFDLQLDVQQQQQLRPHMKVDVFLVTAAKQGILRVANGPTFKGPASQDVFVLRQGKAERHRIQTGLSNFDYVEVSAPLRAGDSVIISDMSAFKHANVLSIIN